MTNEKRAKILAYELIDDDMCELEATQKLLAYADEIRRECADMAVAWVNKNLCDMHMPIMCERLERDELRSFILSTEPSQHDGRLKCNICGNIETPPYAEGDTCYCGGEFKPAREES